MGQSNISSVKDQRRCLTETVQLARNRENEEVVNKKWLCINEKLAYWGITKYTNKALIIHLEQYLDKVRRKLESTERRVIDNDTQFSLNVK
jgi:hypothetical protein